MAPSWTSPVPAASSIPTSPPSRTQASSSSSFLGRVQEGQQTSLSSREEGGGGGGGLTMEDLVFRGGGGEEEEDEDEDAVLVGVEEEEEEEWMVVEGGRRRSRALRERGSGSVPLSTPSIPLDEEQEEETHLVRPKSRSFHHSGSSSPWRRTAMSTAVEGLPFSSNSTTTSVLHHHSTTLPTSISTPSQHQENLHLSIPNLLSYSLSSLSDPPAPAPAPPTSTPPETTDPTPPVLSPALSFLSAFSSPKSSIFLPSSKPVSPDDQGQPAGSTPHILGKLLGQGGSGLVREVLDATTKERLHPPQAVKVILTRSTSTSSTSSTSSSSSSTKPSPSRIAQEITLWSTISPTHPHLVPLLSHHSTPQASYLFMPYMPNGSLFDFVKRHREHDRGRSGSGIMSSSFRARAGSSRGGVGPAALPEGEARRLFKGVVEGLRWLHKEGGIVHGDLKAENVLIDAEGRCRLADFGLAVRYRPSSSSVSNSPRVSLLSASPLPLPLESTSTSTTPTLETSSSSSKPKPVYPPNLGSSSVHRAHTISSPHPRLASSPFPSSHHTHLSHTPHQRPPSPPTFPPGSLPYASPELLRPPPHAPTSPSQDIWSLGVLLFFLLTSGTLPFQDAFEPRLQMKIARGIWELPEGILVGRQAEEVLRGCLEVEVRERWGVEEVGASEWVQGWEEVLPRSRSKSRSRSRQRGGAMGGAAFELRGERERSRSRIGNASPSTHSNLSPGLVVRGSGRDEDVLSTPNQSTSPPNAFSRRFPLTLDTNPNPSLEHTSSLMTSPSTGTSSSSGLPTPTSRSRSRGRSHQARSSPSNSNNIDDPSLSSSSSDVHHSHLNASNSNDGRQSGDGGGSSRSRSRGGRSRSRKRGEGGLVVEEMERVDEVEASLGRGRR